MQSLGWFLDGPRFLLRRRLGAGGFGTVYEAFDRRYAATVALKVLHETNPNALVRFKQEFRVLSDVVHPNLVTLHELLSDQPEGEGEGQSREQGRWFFTMDFVDGTDILDYIHAGAPDGSPAGNGAHEAIHEAAGQDTPADPPTITLASPHAGATSTAAPGAAAAEPAAPRPRRPPPHLRLVDLRRLRSAFGGLANALRVLHGIQVVHRDLKPSNVLVTRDGQVVLLDFGLAKELAPWLRQERWQDGSPAGAAAAAGGTPPYMAPEQVARAADTPAVDWYGFGIMLYEALTGRLPFVGSPAEIMRAKLARDPDPPSALRPDIPPDLDALCAALMRRDPGARPGAEEVLRSLQQAVPALAGDTLRPGPPVGRDAEMAALLDAFQASRKKTVVVRVFGESGIGKSTLARHFLDTLRERENAVIIAGRCYERESVPYKALDSLMDGLCRYLGTLAAADIVAMAPKGIDDLVRLFPVLRTVRSLGPFPRTGEDESHEVLDPPKARWRGFQACKELLRHVAARGPLVLCIDDLHWGDVDSAQLLFELLSPPDEAVFLLLACYRLDEASDSACLDELTRLESASAMADGREGRLDVRELPLGPLAWADTVRLAADRLGGVAGSVETVARESGGNPLSVEDLARYVGGFSGAEDVPAIDTIAGAAMPAGQGGAAATPDRATLDRATLTRLRRLPDPSRRLLEIAAVAGHPLQNRVAFHAAHLGDDKLSGLTPLRAAKLVRTRRVRDLDTVEISHDRVRDVVVHALAPDAVRRHHHDLALAYEAEIDPGAEPDVLAVHWSGAGDLSKAARYAEDAGERASAALAFDRAAELYLQALTCLEGGGAEVPAPSRRSLQRRRAVALANAGRCADAARLFMAAAGGASAAEARELRVRATEQFMVGGHLDDGITVLVPLLSEVRLRYPRSTFEAVLTVLTLLVRLRARGHGYRPRPASEIDPDLLTRIDLCGAVSRSLTDVDPLRAAAFQLKGALLSLQAGEEVRVASALAALGLVAVLQGAPRGVAEGSRLLAEADALAEKTGDARLRGTVDLYGACVSLVRGEFPLAVRRFDDAGRYLQDHCVGVPMEHNLAQAGGLVALEAMGRFDEVGARSTSWHGEASAVGNLFAKITAAINAGMASLANGDPAGARQRAQAARAEWTQGGMHVQHMYSLRVEIYADLYEGEGERAHRRLLEHWRAIVMSQQLRIQLARIDMLSLRGRTALAAAHQSARGRKKLAADVARTAARLDRELRGDARATAEMLRAGLASIAGATDRARAHLEAAVSVYQAHGMQTLAACGQLWNGVVVGGHEGRALLRQGEETLRGLGVTEPVRWALAFAPGFGTETSVRSMREAWT